MNGSWSTKKEDSVCNTMSMRRTDEGILQSNGRHAKAAAAGCHCYNYLLVPHALSSLLLLLKASADVASAAFVCSG
jgi:hypothetical protein